MNSEIKKRIFAQNEKCNGCRICELRCSFEHEKVFSPFLSRIQVIKNEVEGITIPKVCVICGKCIEACPEKAISKSPITGAIQIDKELCTGCKICVEACPFDVMRFNPEKNIAITCDLCDGDPQCVKYCPEEALHFKSAKEFAEYKRKDMDADKPEVIP